jgi:hypothetical protein
MAARAAAVIGAAVIGAALVALELLVAAGAVPMPWMA